MVLRLSNSCHRKSFFEKDVLIAQMYFYPVIFSFNLWGNLMPYYFNNSLFLQFVRKNIYIYKTKS